MRFRTRQMFIGQRTQTINALRGHLGVDSGWVQNSTLGSEDALAVVSQIAVRVDVAIESNGPHA